MESKPIQGNKTYFYCCDKKKYFKIIEAVTLKDRNNNNVYADCKVKECTVKFDKETKVPKDDHSKELKTIKFYDLIPTGRKIKYSTFVYGGELIDNFYYK